MILTVENIHSSSLELDRLRDLIHSCLTKSQYASAAVLADRLTVMQGSNTADYVLYAKCFYLDGQPRRCLAVLEQRGLLSSAVVGAVGQWLLGNKPTLPAEYRDSDCMNYLGGVQLAAQSLFILDQFEDCISLLQPIINFDHNESKLLEMIDKIKLILSPILDNEVNIMAGIYCLIGKCYDLLEHRSRALKCLLIAIKLDMVCVEAAEYIVDNGLLTELQRLELFVELAQMSERSWMLPVYRSILLTESALHSSSTDSLRSAVFNSTASLSQSSSVDPTLECSSSSWLSRQAVHWFDSNNALEAYRLSRQAYLIDPYDNRGLVVYIASMVVLRYKTELFYLAHELVNSYPKVALSWYSVGCYYWACMKYELAQKHLVKATKLDKRFAKAWTLLGHVMSSQEESEQAVSAYRTAARLLPGDHRPIMYMAKELARTNFLSPALHLLLGALDISPDDTFLLNELGVIHLKQGKVEESVNYFEKAIHAIERRSAKRTASSDKNNYTSLRCCNTELFSNYATAMRKSDRFEDALYWYDKCLAANPDDANCHASIGFTFHLMQRFDLAISSYHQALSIQPNHIFCADMLSKVMEDYVAFPIVYSDSSENILHPTFSTSFSNLEIDISSSDTNTADTTNHQVYDEDVMTNHEQLGCDEEYLTSDLDFALSVAESYSRIEERLSLSAWQDNSALSQSRYDDGGFLDDSFER